MKLCCLCCRRRGAGTEHGDDVAASLPRQRRADDPAVFTVVPLRQHVAVQLRRAAAEAAAVLARVGSTIPPEAGTCPEVGRTARPRAGCRLPPRESCTGPARLALLHIYMT